MKRLLETQQVRFLLAGCFNTALDFLLLNVMTLAFGAAPLVANSVSVTAGIAISYLLNHFFVFRYPEPLSLRKFAAFFAITGFSSLIIQNLIILGFEVLFDSEFGNSLLLLPDSVVRESITLNIAKVFAVLAGLVWNFTAYKFLIFRSPNAERALKANPEAEPSTPAV